MKKIMLMVMVALSFIASAQQTKGDLPMPQCQPCPSVR
jgi:hypothetical protein